MKRKHPNWIDIAFVLLLAAVALVAYFLSHQTNNPNQNAVERTYILELTTLPENAADYIKVGDKVTDNVRNYEMGEVTAIEVKPAMSNVFDKIEKRHKDVEFPGKVNLYITVTAETTEDEDEINTVGGYTLRVGSWVSCTIGELTANGYIVVLER